MTQFTDRDKIQQLQQIIDKLEERILDYENKLKDMELEDMIDDKEGFLSNSKNNQTHTRHVPFVASSRSDDF
jgi:uncharacterized protein YlxW (UPF0749 family)